MLGAMQIKCRSYLNGLSSCQNLFDGTFAIVDPRGGCQVAGNPF